MSNHFSAAEHGLDFKTENVVGMRVPGAGGRFDLQTELGGGSGGVVVRTRERVGAFNLVRNTNSFHHNKNANCTTVTAIQDRSCLHFFVQSFFLFRKLKITLRKNHCPRA